LPRELRDAPPPPAHDVPGALRRGGRGGGGGRPREGRVGRVTPRRGHGSRPAAAGPRAVTRRLDPPPARTPSPPLVRDAAPEGRGRAAALGLAPRSALGRLRRLVEDAPLAVD